MKPKDAIAATEKMLSNRMQSEVKIRFDCPHMRTIRRLTTWEFATGDELPGSSCGLTHEEDGRLAGYYIFRTK